MTINTIDDVEFGAELPSFEPDTSLASVGQFADAVGWGAGARFKDHEAGAQGRSARRARARNHGDGISDDDDPPLVERPRTWSASTRCSGRR